MKPLQQFSFFITRGAPTANGLAEFTAVGNSCHKDCPGVRVSWYCSSLPWSHRNPSPSDAAVSQKKLSTSNGTLRTVGLSPKKSQKHQGPDCQTLRFLPKSSFQISRFLGLRPSSWWKTGRWDLYVSGAMTEAEASELGLSSLVVLQSNLNELTTSERFFFFYFPF